MPELWLFKNRPLAKKRGSGIPWQSGQISTTPDFQDPCHCRCRIFVLRPLSSFLHAMFKTFHLPSSSFSGLITASGVRWRQWFRGTTNASIPGEFPNLASKIRNPMARDLPTPPKSNQLRRIFSYWGRRSRGNLASKETRFRQCREQHFNSRRIFSYWGRRSRGIKPQISPQKFGTFKLRHSVGTSFSSKIWAS